MVGVYKTNYNQYEKYDSVYDTNSKDYVINNYNKNYFYNTVFTSVGFTDRQASTIKQINYPLYIKNLQGFTFACETARVTTKDAEDVYSSYLKIYKFSPIAFNSANLKENEIILPVNVFNELWNQNINSKDLFEAADSVAAFELIKSSIDNSWILNHFDNLYVEITAKNGFDIAYKKYKIVGVSTAYSGGIELEQEFFNMTSSDFNTFVKPITYTQNVLAVSTDNSDKVLSSVISYAKKEKLSYITAGGKYVEQEAKAMRKYGVFVSVILMLASGIAFGFVYFRDNVNSLKDKANTLKECIKTNWWQALIIFGSAFVASIIVVLFATFMLNIIINAVLGHLLIELTLTKLTYIIMFNLALVMIVSQYIASSLYMLKKKEPATIDVVDSGAEKQPQVDQANNEKE